MRLNLGCGRHVLEGWVNIDVQRSPHAKREPEYLCDLRGIPLPDACADEAMAIHVFEHFYEWETSDVLTEWRRLLKAGGKLVLELPDLVKCCRNVLEGRAGKDHPEQLTMWGLYGDPAHRDPFMCHRWGWSPNTLSAKLTQHGFVNIKQELPQWHAVGKVARDMRLVAFKSH